MRGGCRVNGQALHVGDIGEQRENLQVVDEFPGRFLAALNLEREDRGAAVGEVTLVELVVGVVGQARVVHGSHVRVVSQELDDLLRVLDMAIDAQRQRLGALQQNPCVERRDASAFVAQQNGAHVGRECSRAYGFGEAHAMVARVGFGDFGVLAARFPVEVAAVDDHAAERATVAADELSRGMHHDVRAVLKRTEQVRRAEGVVDYDGQPVLLSDFGNGVDVGNVGVRVAERFEVNDGGVVFDGAFDLGEVVRVDEGGFDAELRKRVLEQVVRAAVDGLLRNHVVAGLREGLQRVGNGGGAGGYGQASHAAFKCGDAVLEHALG